MGTTQIMKRHMLNKSLNNALKSDHKMQLKSRPILDSDRRHKSGPIQQFSQDKRAKKTKQLALHQKLMVLGRY